MQALRTPVRRSGLPSALSKRYATTVAASSFPTSSKGPVDASHIPLAQVPQHWHRMSFAEKEYARGEIEQLTAGDWKLLSADVKRTAYWVTYGPHGARTPVSAPGDGLKIFGGVAAAISFAGLLMFGFRLMAPEPPKTITREWQEASNERAIEQNMNPITGITSEGYKGKGFVVSK